MATLVALGCALVLLVLVRVWTERSGAEPPPTTPPALTSGEVDLHWRPFRPGQELPESRSAGPARHLGGRAAGFSRTELGAALAAIHLGHRIDPTTGPAIFEPTIREQVVGAEADRLRKQTSDTYETQRRNEGRPPDEPLDPGAARLVAYKVESYTPEVATVSMFTAYEDRSQFFSFRLEVRWSEDDWRLVAPSGGGLANVLTRITALPNGAVALSRGS